MTDDHILVNRASWDEDAPNWVERGRETWTRKEPVWGRGNTESELHLLSDVTRLDAVELGCGTAYVSAWLTHRGARVIALDNSSNQLMMARMFQEEFGLRFPLVHGDAEHPPFADESFDFAISQYGASIWCDPYRWIPEASRFTDQARSEPLSRLPFAASRTCMRASFPGGLSMGLRRPEQAPRGHRRWRPDRDAARTLTDEECRQYLHVERCPE